MKPEILEKAMEFVKTIPMDELYDVIRRITNLPDLTFTEQIKIDKWDQPQISFESQDIADKVGFLRLMFKEIQIANFNSSVKYVDNEDDPTQPGYFYYWGTACFRYTHPNGGSNGCDFLSFKYIQNQGWKFDI